MTQKGQTRDPNMLRVQYLENDWRNYLATVVTSGVTMGWLLRLVVTGGPLVRGPPTVPEFLMINLNVCVCCY